jgi:hypothetical protein
LHREGGTAILTGEKGNRCRQASPGAVSHDANSRGIYCEFAGRFVQPRQRKKAVIQSSRKLVLRRESIIDAYDQTPGVSSQVEATAVSDVEIAKNESTTVNLQKRSAHGATDRLVNTNVNGTTTVSDRLVSDLDLRVPAEFWYRVLRAATREIERFSDWQANRKGAEIGLEP